VESPRLKGAAVDAATKALGSPAAPLRPMVERVLARLVAEVGGSYLRDGTVPAPLVQELPLQP
jgi:hypothetical protein